MPQPHWNTPDNNNGCQATECTNPATWAWQRTATPQETETYQNRQGPYGPIYTNPNNPTYTAVFACNNHTPQNPDNTPNLDQMAKTHQDNCPLPDPGCECP